MPAGHPYYDLEVPVDVPFELRPSPGKGWGAFATKHIDRGSLILSEKPTFIIRKSHTEITDYHVTMAFQKLSPSQRAQFLLLRNNGTGCVTSMNEAFAENSFNIANSDRDEPEAHGLFLLHSRFNHSCIPNSKVPTISNAGLDMSVIKLCVLPVVAWRVYLAPPFNNLVICDGD
ncbi:hypothetical protein VN97_g3538 [Penicillium thymicola]|uniref:SET domain-containing protein n=1 Tax=Penicillium thymicola TaxID=293382 RepID=A0AAI9TMC8_PENTH|nr:hypothetical protein VN97_g3538 [Penicillium thymicola]